MRSVKFAVTLAAIAAQALALDKSQITYRRLREDGPTADTSTTTTSTGGKGGGSSGSSSSEVESEQEICQHAINDLRNQSADINEVL